MKSCGFRVALGGAQSIYGDYARLDRSWKVIGGSLACRRIWWKSKHHETPRASGRSIKRARCPAIQLLWQQASRRLS